MRCNMNETTSGTGQRCSGTVSVCAQSELLPKVSEFDGRSEIIPDTFRLGSNRFKRSQLVIPSRIRY